MTPQDQLEIHKHKKEEQPNTIEINGDGFWFFKKNIAWISASACIYMYIGYLFFSGYVSFGIKEETSYPTVIMKTPEIPVQKTKLLAKADFLHIEHALTEPDRNTQLKSFDNYSISPIEPEPGDIIDWLIEKK